MNPTTIPIARIPPARISTFAARMVSFDSIPLPPSACVLQRTLVPLLGSSLIGAWGPNRPELLFLGRHHFFDGLNQRLETQRFWILGQVSELLLRPQGEQARAEIGVSPVAATAKRNQVYPEHAGADSPFRFSAGPFRHGAHILLHTTPKLRSAGHNLSIRKLLPCIHSRKVRRRLSRL